jgi:hypothetical protein
MKDCYQNKESKEIEKTLNEARDQLIKDGMPPDCMLPVEVWFTKSLVSKKEKDGK